MIYLRRHVLFFSFIFTILFIGLAFLVNRYTKSVSKVAVPDLAVADTSQDAKKSFRLPSNSDELFVYAGGEETKNRAEEFFASLNSRFRLAAVQRSSSGNAFAVIEDKSDGRQWMKRKGEKLTESAEILSVEAKSIIIATPFGDYEMLQSDKGKGGSSGSGRVVSSSDNRTSVSSTIAKLEAGKTNEGIWELSRDDVMDYFNEVKERPERFEALFDTLAPIWYTDEADGKQKIEGYRVEICGEEDFFKAVGFNEGDIVREVNGIKMTNRFAAEELIRRFIHNDLEFAHIRMERDGEEVIQSYLLDK